MNPTAAHPWDGFLVGPENQLAFAAAAALARAEPHAISPLVIHGPSGSGKSRLLAGLVAERLHRFPNSPVCLLDAASLLESPQTPAPLDLNVELLALDNLAALNRSPALRAQLASQLDALDHLAAAAAFTCPWPPSAWPDHWPARLVSRLRAGLAVRLQPPGPELLRRYALQRAAALGLTLSPTTLDHLTTCGGFRQLDGLLAQLQLSSRLHLPTPDPPPPTSDPPSIDQSIAHIARLVARHFGVSLTDLRGPRRHPALVTPRHLAIYLARQTTGASFARLARYFGHRDTKAIRHACSATAARLNTNPALASTAQTFARVQKDQSNP
ncbi:MAG: hypothetical protein KatS3mg108_0260 [Isosphaeraceae bacterium]|jgi:chromosomal replication initiator protein|nr:MAG: hypothetical protein KatS3mg108_0260 [Isosphaeraceae bacterium]